MYSEFYGAALITDHSVSKFQVDGITTQAEGNVMGIRCRDSWTGTHTHTHATYTISAFYTWLIYMHAYKHTQTHSQCLLPIVKCLTHTHTHIHPQNLLIFQGSITI